MDHRLEVAARMDRLPITRTHRAAMLAVGLGVFFDLYEVFLGAVLAQVLVREFHLPKSWLPWLIGSGFLGMAIGATWFGRLADRLGRRRAFLWGLWVYSLFSFVGALSAGPSMLLIMRFLAGIGIGAEPVLADAYLSDLLPAKVRGRGVALAYTLGFFGVPCVGFLARFSVNAAPMGIAGWRWMFAIGALGSVILYPSRRKLPESPRWLESVGRDEEARAAVRVMEEEARAEGHALSDVPISPRAHDGSAQPRVRDLLVPPYRRRTVMMTIFQLLQPFAYYGFGTLVPLVLSAKGYTVVTSLSFSAITFLGYPIGSALSLPILDRVERKYVLVGSLVTMAMLGTAFGSARDPIWILVLGALYTTVSNVFSNGFHVYQAEIFPTRLRGLAAGSTYALSRVSNAALPFVLVPLLDERGPVGLFAIIALAVLLNGLNVTLLCPRATGRALEGI